MTATMRTHRCAWCGKTWQNAMRPAKNETCANYDCRLHLRMKLERNIDEVLFPRRRAGDVTDSNGHVVPFSSAAD